ncbi:hypothetical protein QQF64_026060 [Cirrhinus molitorella]|uniref:Transmembrane protein n=1 Tax=Cirrhinus molitorella TaxID=172907 RepID=A0ABR3NRK7_9TELE
MTNNKSNNAGGIPKAKEATQKPHDQKAPSVFQESFFPVIVIIVEFAVFAAPTVILLQIICERRAGRNDSERHREEI